VEIVHRRVGPNTLDALYFLELHGDEFSDLGRVRS
jgi:hypothetical protein